MKRYWYAVVSAGLATLARMVLDRVIGYHHPYAAFYVAVLWSAWYGGLGPAVLTTAVGAIAAVLFVAPPPFLDAHGSGALVGLEFYFIVASTGTILMDAQRRAERKSALNAEIAQKRLDQLEHQTAQRRQAVEAMHQIQEQLRFNL